jgi:serine/threonine protein kinase
MLQLHSKQILHRDLKSANLLVDKHWRVKVADFNLSRVETQNDKSTSISANNPRWLAPEVIASHVRPASSCANCCVVGQVRDCLNALVKVQKHG